MPIFEYACLACGNKRFSRLVGVVAGGNAPPMCPRCGSSDLRKLVSRFARGRAEDDVLERLAEDADQINPDDPRAVRGLLHDMAGSVAEGEMTGDDLEQIMDEATAADADTPSTEG